MERLPNKTLENAIDVYKTTIEAVEEHKDADYCPTLDKATVAFLEELKEYRKIGTPEQVRAYRSKAIDEFAQLIIELNNEFPTVEDDRGEIRPMRIEEMCERIAEQMKRGAK